MEVSTEEPLHLILSPFRKTSSMEHEADTLLVVHALKHGDADEQAKATQTMFSHREVMFKIPFSSKRR